MRSHQRYNNNGAHGMSVGNAFRGGDMEERIPLKHSSYETPTRFDDGDDDDDDPVRHSVKERCIAVVAIVASFLALVLSAKALLGDAVGGDNKQWPYDMDASPQLYDEEGRFVLEDYDGQPPFSDFLPGLAGVYGKPLYAFYINRGQGIASFGTESKDFPIMEFSSANKAYQNTALIGFRTFLQGSRGKRSFLVEPFSPLNTYYPPTVNNNEDRLPPPLLPSRQQRRFMYVGSNEMQIREVDYQNRIETNVTYFIMPEEDFGSFVRRTMITNLDEKQPLTISVLDGLARMEPSGGRLDSFLKNMGRTLEGWMGVYQPYSDTARLPYYRLSTQPSDTADIVVQEAGHYCLAFIEGSNQGQLLPIIYDTSKVFGEDTNLIRPVALQSKSITDIIAEPQYGFAKTASAFAAVDQITLAPGETLKIAAFYGKTDQIMDVPVIFRRVSQEGFVQYKFTRAREITKQITSGVETKTANQLLNGHVQQMYLDNSLRGGIPTILGDVDDNARMRNADEDNRLKVYHLFSRIHGDLERDYNDFVLQSTFYSQGPGSFRDVVQNRRSDVVFNPRIGAFNVHTFLSYIQADAYGPYRVEAVSFSIDDKGVCDELAAVAVGRAEGHRAQREALAQILSDGPFRPGQLFLLMEQQHIELMVSRQVFMDMVAAAANFSPMAVYETGYWADHWTYYMDLIESYLMIYPEFEERLLFDKKLPYFFSPASVKARREKYVLSVGFHGYGEHVRQLDAASEDKDKKGYMDQYIDDRTNWYDLQAHWQHDVNKEQFRSTPAAKLFLLATLKFATRDAYGMGIEYEGGRPGWNDATNGIVGMLGSGMPETFELRALLDYFLSVTTKYNRSIVVPVELANLVEKINAALETLGKHDEDEERVDQEGDEILDVPDALFKYWDAVASAREAYREQVKLVFCGETVELAPALLKSTLKSWIEQVDIGISRAQKIGSHGFGDDGSSGITPTYFSYVVTKWKKTGAVNKDGHPLVYPLKMQVGRFPLFLEGPTRMMKTVNASEARNIYSRVRVSQLRDEALGMYTVSASLQGQSFDMGRSMGFAPGWLENQSVWVHMSYKYYLGLMRHGLFDVFFEEMKSGGMLPFMQSDKYGRSLLECSSFIPSSAFEDPNVRGRGFLARLSGSTAEFLSMWILMMIGPKLFFIETSGEVRMQLQPALPSWLFYDNDDGVPTVSFKLFGSITVNYYNPGKKDVLRIPPTRYVIGLRDGSTFDISGPTIPFELADKIRRVVFVDSIDAYF